MIVAALRLQVARKKRYSMCSEVTNMTDHMPTKQELEELRQQLEQSVSNFKKVRQCNSEIIKDATETKITELKNNLNELQKKFDYFAALMIEK